MPPPVPSNIALKKRKGRDGGPSTTLKLMAAVTWSYAIACTMLLWNQGSDVESTRWLALTASGGGSQAVPLPPKQVRQIEAASRAKKTKKQRASEIGTKKIIETAVETKKRADDPEGAEMASKSIQNKRLAELQPDESKGAEMKEQNKFTEATMEDKPLAATELSEMKEKTFQLDVGVPVSGNTEKLLLLASNIGNAAKRLSVPRFHAIRMLITRYKGDDTTNRFVTRMKQAADVANFRVEFVPMTNATQFHRAHACNALHDAACTNPECILTVIDVDMSVDQSYLENVWNYVGDAASPEPVVYFPVVWSQFHNSSIELIEKVLDRPMDRSKSIHAGVYRKYGYGMYAFPGNVSTLLRYNESFVGWGGEDKDFHAKAKVKEKYHKVNIRRENEPGLVHVWHDKSCKLGAFVSSKFYKECIGSRNRVQGSIFGRLLLAFGDEFVEWLIQKRKSGTWSSSQIDEWFSKEPEQFGTWFRDEQRQNTDDFQFLSNLFLTKIMDNPSIEVDRDALMQYLSEANVPYSMLHIELKAMLAKGDTAKKNILILVYSSRKDIKRRGSAIEQTWGLPETLPSNVFIQYATGALNPKFARKYESGSAKDKSALARTADISDPSRISILPRIAEIMSALRRAKHVQLAKELVETIEQETGNLTTFDWIMMVQDDTYVNIQNLQRFVDGQDATKIKYLGLKQQEADDPKQQQSQQQKNKGKKISENDPTACHDAAGIVLSKPALAILAGNVEDCVKRVVDGGSDVLVGICLRLRNTKCNADDDSVEPGLFMKHPLPRNINLLDPAAVSKAITIYSMTSFRFTKDRHEEIKQHLKLSTK